MALNVKVIGMDQVQIMPPLPGVCPICAADHDPAWPHNRDSLYYQIKFQQKHGRFPTWADAMAHCGAEMKAAWKEELLKRGVPPEQLEEHGQARVDGV